MATSAENEDRTIVESPDKTISRELEGVDETGERTVLSPVFKRLKETDQAADLDIRFDEIDFLESSFRRVQKDPNDLYFRSPWLDIDNISPSGGTIIEVGSVVSKGVLDGNRFKPSQGYSMALNEEDLGFVVVDPDLSFRMASIKSSTHGGALIELARLIYGPNTRDRINLRDDSSVLIVGKDATKLNKAEAVLKTPKKFGALVFAALLGQIESANKAYELSQALVNSPFEYRKAVRLYNEKLDRAYEDDHETREQKYPIFKLPEEVTSPFGDRIIPAKLGRNNIKKLEFKLEEGVVNSFGVVFNSKKFRESEGAKPMIRRYVTGIVVGSRQNPEVTMAPYTHTLEGYSIIGHEDFERQV